MEWLINRRRMMFNKAVPPAYLTFEDSRAWELCCYEWGDTEVIQGNIDNGTITCDGTNFVSSSYVFCPCFAIPSHKLANGRTISANAAAQNFEIVISANNSSIFDSLGDDDIAIKISQHSLNDSTQTELSSITKAQWVSEQVNNQITISVTSTNTCVYLYVSTLGTNNSTVNWSINTASGSRQPVGITAKQCSVVTSNNLNWVFRNNPIIVSLNDLVYFTSLTNIIYTTFAYMPSLQYIWLPYTVTAGSFNSGANSCIIGACKKMIGARMDSIQQLGSYNYNSNRNYTVITTSEVPALNTNRWAYGVFYVLDNLVSDYQAATNWGSNSDITIKSILDLPTDKPNCPWLDDLRAKGFIPSN